MCIYKIKINEGNSSHTNISRTHNLVPPLEEKAAVALGNASMRMKLVYNGKNVDDLKTVADYCIKEDSELKIVSTRRCKGNSIK